MRKTLRPRNVVREKEKALEALTAVLLGGTLKRGSWIYRFLSYWLGVGRIEKIEDSCQLRAALLNVEFWMLAGAFLAALVFRVFTIKDPLTENLLEPLPTLLGTSQFLLGMNLLVVGYYASGAIVRRLGLGRVFEKVLMMLLATLFIIGVPSGAILALSAVGGIVNESLDLGFEDTIRDLPPVYVEYRTEHPGGGFSSTRLDATKLVVYAIFGAVVVFVIAAFFYGSWQFFRHFQSWAAKTHFWEWLKGRLCRKIAIED